MNQPTNCLLSIWCSDSQRRLHQVAITGPVQLKPRDEDPVLPVATRYCDDAVIVPAQPQGPAVAVILVPESYRYQAALNNVPLRAGIHLLAHTDRVDVAGRSFWISAHSLVEQAEYAPDIHGAHVFCFLTKARILAGEPIKICPGLPGVPCGAIYKADAWDMAMSPDSRIKCANCGYRPDQEAWQPDMPEPRRTSDDLALLLNT